MRRSIIPPLLVLALASGTSAGLAQTEGGGAGGSPPLAGTPETSDQPSAQPATPSIQSSLGAYGDPGGLRGTLADKGVTYSLTYIGEMLADVSGGQRRGAIYEGRLDGQLDIDLGKVAGLDGAALHANFYQIHGHGLSRYYLANLNVASGIEALSSSRLYELWVEQKLLDDKLSIRVGQLAADTEFVVSQYATLFVNSTFGFPAILAADLPGGGPAYPLATPGIRIKYAPTSDISAMLAVFNGNPAGPGPGDPQRNNPGGLEFRTQDPALFMAEASYTYNKEKDALAGTVKLGGFAQLGRFNSLRGTVEPDGSVALLADPSTSGIARRLGGNGGAYAIIDQMLYRTPDTDDGGIGLFTRIAGAPGDRNFVNFYIDAGLTYKGILPGRPDDTFGISVAHSRISDTVRAFDLDTAAFNPGVFQPIRTSETLLEATYQAQVVPGWTVQPDVQYVVRPGGGQVNVRSPSGSIERNALIAGVRTTIHY